MSKPFKTRDIYLASLLYAQGKKYLSMEKAKDANGKEISFFIFEDYEKCTEIEKAYFNYQEMVIAKKFVDSFKTMKNVLFGYK